MDGKLRNMTAVYLFKGKKFYCYIDRAAEWLHAFLPFDY